MIALTVIGLMSGTSADGIDAALLESDGRQFRRLGFEGVFPYRFETKTRIWQAMADPIGHVKDRLAHQQLGRLIAEDHATAVRALLTKSGLRPNLIGFHGQTIYHNPAGIASGATTLDHATIQLGDAALLAKLTGIDVVYDVRRADIAAGGQGAPLAPVYHKAVFDSLGTDLPAVLVNIGGVANITFYGGSDELIGFDTGPGNALLDDYMRRYCEADYDEDGALAASGTADEQLVDMWMKDVFFSRAWPKSLDRQAFHACLEAPQLETMSAADAMASLTLFTGRSIAIAIEQLPTAPRRIMLAGGGRNNRCLFELLKRLVGSALLAPPDDNGFSGDMLEAELMGFLAARHFAGLPTSFPNTTGCTRPVCGGRLVRAS